MTNGMTISPWQVIAEKPRGERGWPAELNTLFELTRRKVEAGTHVMCTRFVERMNPDTWELEEFEQRVVKQCRKPLQPFEFWSRPVGSREIVAAMKHG